MKKSKELLLTNCPNCGAEVNGAYCQECGQSLKDHSDRSLTILIKELFQHAFFLDNRFFITVRYLFCFPSLMTVQFLNGQRKKFLAPIPLFLIFNLLYFSVKPLTDYSLAFYDQVYSQPYSELIYDWVATKMKEKNISEAAYGPIYQRASDNISKTIMIINIPMMAFFIYLMAFKRRRFYYDSLIFAFHFFSIVMFSLVLLDWSGRLIQLFDENGDSLLADIAFPFFTLLMPLIYAILGIKRFMDIRWYWAIPAGVVVIFSVVIANFFYRLIIFLLTFSLT